METAFDVFGYARKLEKAGFTREQAELQAEGLKAQSEAIGRALKEYDAEKRQEIATKGDIKDLRLEMREMELRLLKWQIAIDVAIAVPILTALAKGFGWLGI